MITIKVNNRQLYIPQDTALVLEQHNNSFDIDNIGADIIWTFDIPATPNAIALNNAQYICVSNYKRYRCEVGFNGVTIASGVLYVQSVTDEKRISCGIILDGLGEEFGQRMLKENDYGDDIVISQLTDTLEQHRENWLEFLRTSFSDESVYKFFLFSSEQFYKNNEAYGYHKNQPAALGGENDEKLWTKYVNRLLYWRVANYQYWPVGLPNNAALNERIFNTLGNNTDKLNGYAFAPAIRLDWLVKKVFANAGYHVTGDFLTNKYIKQLYLQSMNAMDGDMTQFGLDEYLYISSGASGQDGVKTDGSLDIGINEVSYEGFKLLSAPTFNFRLNADTENLTRNVQLTPTEAKPWTVEDEVLMLLIRTSSMAKANKYPHVRSVVNSSASRRDYIYGLHTFGTNETRQKFVTYDGNYMRVYGYGTSTTSTYGEHTIVTPSDGLYCIQLTPSKGDTGASYIDTANEADILGHYTAAILYQQGSKTEAWVVELAKFKVRSVEHGTWDQDPRNITHTVNIPVGESNANHFIQHIHVQKYGQLEELEFIETIAKTRLSNTNTSLNVFDTMLRWKQHVPNVNNADFIKKICRFFGLSLYVNPFQNEVQLSFVNNIFEADAMDITEYITGSERLAYEPKQYKVGVDTVLGKKSVAEDFLMPSVSCHNDLVTARSKKRMSAFVENENAYNHSTLDSDSGKYIWETSAGNDRQLVIGSEGEDVEELTTGIAVPNMRVVDVGVVTRRVCDIPTSGNSKLMDDDYTGEFDMILQQYKGQRFANVVYNSLLGFCEQADPTSLDANGQTDSGEFLDLATTGPKSVGELWLRRFYEFMAKHENYRFTAMLPLNVFLQVYRMQQPQHVAVCHEKRWIMVKNRKYMPMSITYEFGRQDTVLATIECARMHYE